MSKYSLTIGSFIRTGNYPLEANYIFPNEAALKEYYQDPVNSSTLHKGLFKIVENNGNGKQGLYWILPKETNDELEFTELISGNNIQDIYIKLSELNNNLELEILQRKNENVAIWGTNDPTNLIEELNSLLDLSETILQIKIDILNIYSELVDSDTSIKNSLKTELKATVGTVNDDIVSYLLTIPYHTLTEASNALHKFLNTRDTTSNQINTLPELKFFLEGYEDSQKLRHVLMDLKAEISGTPLPSADFATLRAIEDFVRILKADSENTDKNLQSELDLTLIGVGLSADGSFSPDKSTNYLQDATSVMNALHTLDHLMVEALRERLITAQNNDVVDLVVRKELEGYVIGAKLKLSNVLGNDLIKKEDGLYYNTDLTYKDGVLSLIVNDKIVATHVLGFSSLVESAIYDPSQESIVIVFKLLNGEKQNVVIPVGALIREWEIDNGQVDHVVELTRTTAIDGPDKLSADVRLYADRHNILVKKGNTLFVDGQSDNITHNDMSLAEVIELIKSSIAENSDEIVSVDMKLDGEISRATNKELEIIAQHNEDKLELKGDIQELKSETSANFSTTNTNLQAEVNRATLKENALESDIRQLKVKDTQLEEADTALSGRITGFENNLTRLDGKVDSEIQRATNVESGLNTRVEALEGASIALDAKISAEVDRAKAAEITLEGKVHLQKDEIDDIKDDIADIKTLNATQSGQIETLKTNVNNLANADTALDNKIAQETERANNAENLLDQRIDLFTNKINTFETKVNTESERALLAETQLQTSITALEGKVDLQKEQLHQEIHEATDTFKDQVTQLTSDIEDDIELVSQSVETEKERAKAAETTLQTAVNQERVRAEAAETVLTGKVGSLETAVQTQDLKLTDVSAAVIEEKTRALVAESTLESAINVEVNRATSAENVLDTRITTEVQLLTTKTDAIQQAVNNKVGSIQLYKNNDLQYSVIVDGQSIGEIDIPKDQFLKSAKYNSVSKELTLVFVTNTGETESTIDISDLVDTYLAGDGLKLVDNKFSVKVSPASESYLSVNENGVSINGVGAALALKANTSDVYNKTEADAKFLTEHQSLAHLATKEALAEVEIAVEDTYTKAEADGKFLTEHQDISHLAPIYSPTFTGIPQVETSPDATDASQRIPSTNWVKERIIESIGTLSNDLRDHLLDFGNPHRITANQIGVYTKSEIDIQLNNIYTELNKKATLSENGKILTEQLPEGVFTWIEL